MGHSCCRFHDSPTKYEMDFAKCKNFDFHHNDSVLCLSRASYSPKMIFTGSADNTVKLLNIVNGRTVRTFCGHTNELICCNYSRFNRFLVGGGRDNSICLWDSENGKLLHHLKNVHEFSVSAVEFDGKYGSNRIIVSGSRDCTIKAFDIKTMKEIFSKNISRNLVREVCWLEGKMLSSSDNNLFVQTSEDLTIKIWDVRKGDVVKSFKNLKYIQNAVDVHENGMEFVTCGKGFNKKGSYTSLWDIRKESEAVMKYECHSQAINKVRFLPKENFFVTCGNDRKINLWRKDLRQPVETISVINEMPYCVGVLDGSDTICVGGFENFLSIYELRFEKGNIRSSKLITKFQLRDQRIMSNIT